MSRAINQTAFMTSWTKPADDWSRAKAAEMHAAGYDAGTIVRHLEAYGIGFYAAQALVRGLQDRGSQMTRGRDETSGPNNALKARPAELRD